MDAHQVLAVGRCGGRGGSRWELVGRAGGSGRGKGAEEGEEEAGGGAEEEEERPGAPPRGEGSRPIPDRPTAPSARSAAWGARVLRSQERRV